MLEPLYRVGFASCARIDYKDAFSKQPPCILDTQDYKQPVWGQIATQHEQQKLDAMLLLGDQVYSDYGPLNGFGGSRPKNWTVDRFHNLMYEMYKAQYSQVTGFKDLFLALRDKGSKIGAVWDDHDFGYNNASGIEPKFENKLGSAKVLFEQFVQTLSGALSVYPKIPGLPIARPTIGIERIDSPIQLGNEVEIVLLDSRFYRAKNGRKNGEMLGAKQWAALENKLKNWDASKLLILCMGSTYSTYGIGADQSWAQTKTGQPAYAHFKEFTDLARDKHIIYLSGDIHENQFVDHGGFCEVVSSGAHLPTERDSQRYGVLEIYQDKVEVKLFRGGAIESHLSKTIGRATGSVL